MSPFLEEKDVILVNKLAYLFKNPKKNDIVVLKNPQKDKKRLYVIKRVKEIKKINCMFWETIKMKVMIVGSTDGLKKK
jgi:signal peptidase I